jgi:nucleotide-binding universal stress UspA family protein
LETGASLGSVAEGVLREAAVPALLSPLRAERASALLHQT